MKVNWEYFWRNFGFHFVWYLVAPIAWLFTIPRGWGGLKNAEDRMDSVYDSIKKKFVLRPTYEAPLRKLEDDDFEFVIGFADKYKMNPMEVYQIWEDNQRRRAMTIQQLQAHFKGK